MDKIRAAQSVYTVPDELKDQNFTSTEQYHTMLSGYMTRETARKYSTSGDDDWSESVHF